MSVWSQHPPTFLKAFSQVVDMFENIDGDDRVKYAVWERRILAVSLPEIRSGSNTFGIEIGAFNKNGRNIESRNVFGPIHVFPSDSRPAKIAAEIENALVSQVFFDRRGEEHFQKTL